MNATLGSVKACAKAAFGDDLPAGEESTLVEILNPSEKPEVIDLTGTGLYL